MLWMIEPGFEDACRAVRYPARCLVVAISMNMNLELRAQLSELGQRKCAPVNAKATVSEQEKRGKGSQMSHVGLRVGNWLMLLSL